MKTLLHVSLLALASIAYAADTASTAEVRPAITDVGPLKTYQEVLAVLPADMQPENAKNWSTAEKEVANGILKRKLVDAGRHGVFTIKAEGVEDWGHLVLWSHLSSDEGYPIRFFSGKFIGPNALRHLATIRKGDRVRVEGRFVTVKFENLWGTESLSICCDDCTLTKLEPGSAPPSEPTPHEVSIISAVYGSGDHFADVTDRLKELLEERGARPSAKPNWLGADPTPGWNKALVVVYEIEGEASRHLFTCGEGCAVSASILAKHAMKK